MDCNKNLMELPDKFGSYQGIHPFYKKRSELHEHPFDSLYSHCLLIGPKSSSETSENCFIEYYFEAYPYPLDWIESMKKVKAALTEDIVMELLGNLGWRERRLGAYYACVGEFSSMIDIVGVHLLKSEQPFAGYHYLLSIAYFNSEKGLKYLRKYLDFYLSQYHLDYDQYDAIRTLCYLDNLNKTSIFSEYQQPWNEYLLKRFENYKSQGSANTKTTLEELQNQYKLDYTYIENEIEMLNKINFYASV